MFSASAGAATYFGATISGETYGHADNSHAPDDAAAWDLFERHAGRKVAVLNQGQRWVTFDKASMDATRDRGAIPMVTMGLEPGMTLADIVNGSQDTAIKKWAQAARAWGQPFFLSLWWEMNGNWYGWGRSADFKAAWQRFHGLVVGEGATNVTFTWTVNSIWSDPLSDPSLYYPGDAFVDWVGLDSYNWGRSPVQADKWINPEQTLTPTVDALRSVAPTKPIVVVENASTEYGGNKANWIREMLTTYLPHHPEIKAYLWFNWNFPKNGLRSDWPIESSPPTRLRFREAIQSSVFVSGPVSLPSLTKVPPPVAVAADPTHPDDISEAAEMATAPDVDIAPDGTATVVWSSRAGAGQFGVFARRIAPDGTLGLVQQLSAAGQDALAPQVAVAPDGTATAVWIRSNGADFQVQARRIDPEGELEAATRTLSGAGQDAEAPQVDVASDGEATVVWQRFDGFHYLAQARRIAPDGTSADPAQRLSEPKQDAVEPQVAVAPEGTATVVWSRFDGADSIVQERRVDADGALETVIENLSAAGESAIQPQVGVGEDGTATVIWSRFDGANWIVQGQRVSPAGTPQGAVLNFSSGGSSAAEPQLGVDPEGRAVVAWTRVLGSGSAIQARRLDATGAPAGAAVDLSPAGDAADPRLALAPDGRATVLWSRFDGAHWVVQRRDLGFDGGIGSLQTLSATDWNAGDPAVAWSGDGILAMAWRRSSGGAQVVQAETNSKPPPPPPAPPVDEDPPGGSGGGPAPGSPSGASAPPAVDNAFRITRVFLNRKRGTATLAVVVPGPGELFLYGGAALKRRQPTSAARVLLRVVPKAPQRRALRRKGSARVSVSVTFAPSGGEPSTRTFTLRLKKARP
ncbi:MAG TPA: glycosyl hydrolase [Solirubrobacterales bacterium]